MVLIWICASTHNDHMLRILRELGWLEKSNHLRPICLRERKLWPSLGPPYTTTTKVKLNLHTLMVCIYIIDCVFILSNVGGYPTRRGVCLNPGHEL